MATDPVCGMTVEEGPDRGEKVAGTTFYFCSEGCRERFLRNPDEYLASEADYEEADP